MSIISEEEQLNIMRQVWNESSDTFWICKPVEDNDFLLIDFNPKEREIMDFVKPGMRLKSILSKAGETLDGYYECLKTAQKVRFEQKPIINGETYLFDTLLIPIKETFGEVIYIVGTSRDITDKYKIEQKLQKMNHLLGEEITGVRRVNSDLLETLETKIKEKLQDYSEIEKENNNLATLQRIHEEFASKDELTSIYNRRKFNELLALELGKINAFNEHLALLMMDIDYFKEINDTYGHLCADNGLREFSALILENIRTNDIFARWGGDEFVLLCPRTTKNQALSLAQKLRMLVERHRFNGIGKITLSIGVGTWGKETRGHGLLQSADDALYQAKKNGRNQVAS